MIANDAPDVVNAFASLMRKCFQCPTSVPEHFECPLDKVVSEYAHRRVLKTRALLQSSLPKTNGAFPRGEKMSSCGFQCWGCAHYSGNFGYNIGGAGEGRWIHCLCVGVARALNQKGCKLLGHSIALRPLWHFGTLCVTGT